MGWGAELLEEVGSKDKESFVLFFINIYASSSVLGTFKYTDSISVATVGRRHFSPVFKNEETAS